MKDEKETKQILRKCAKKEFMEKGYAKASLRQICKNAGVTTGALYFFYKDKEDLFASIVEEPLRMALATMTEHYAAETDFARQGEFVKEDNSDDEEAAIQIIHYMYQYYDEFQLILNQSQGSRFETCLDNFIDITERHYKQLMAHQMKVLPNGKKEKVMDEYMIHWISHLQIETFVYMLNHEKSEKEAILHMKKMIRYFMAGWYGLF